MDKTGPGWDFWERKGRVVLRFRSKPDDRTLQRLKQAGMTYDPVMREWWAYGKADSQIGREVLEIARRAVTWESVGADGPDCGIDESDYPIFHDY